MRFHVHVLGLCVLAGFSTAAPSSPNQELEQRRSLSDIVNGVDNAFSATISGLLGSLREAIGSGDRQKTLDTLQKLKSTKKPKDVGEASKVLKAVVDSKPKDIVEYTGRLIANGIMTGDTADLFSYAQGLFSPENGSDNENRDPPTGESVYPQVSKCDAPYTVPEEKLRAAIYIPETFTYGKLPPVILFPGTGSTGFIAFRGNFIPLLKGVDWADPVWVNVPGLLLDDAQTNAEYAAYALNYIAAITKRNVQVIAWSQGNIDVQWALKYWPSTRKVTEDHVAVSADYNGTILANFVDISGITNAPSVVQQEAGSNFIKTMRSDGGDSGYVPTTSLYSSFFDEIVQPMEGTGASAYLLDARNVGVTNAEVQQVCSGKPDGSFYTHESMLVNPLTFALAKDALTHKGPGEISRLDLAKVCSTYLAPGLGLEDLLITENSIAISGISLVSYMPKVKQEPAVKQYALNAAASC
ncbi:hypothetical protein HG530_010567 [Fusarium avenaceum]|nr:hypothetical protein HG530_010567 [Fusarium avenaceum]